MRKLIVMLSVCAAGVGTGAAAATPPATKAANSSLNDEFENSTAKSSDTVAKSTVKTSGPAAKVVDADAEFKRKLIEMLGRTDKSLKILREQIVQNQSAPFLADLYLQLGDLLAEKSTVLYYLQMQGENRTDTKITATQKFSPVVTTQQEAIAIYEQILKEFPKFDKRDKVLYRLAVSQKSIDESAAFVTTAEKLIKEFPTVKETVQARLLLGQYYFDTQAYVDSRSQLNMIKDCPFPYERNAARYRIGLIDIGDEKFSDALKMFEAVALDDELKEDQNPSELSLKTKVSKTNVKREALIDSIRAYAEVYKDNADPVGYYSRVAPNEALFQETIEKLSFRLIFLKRYSAAINLLRTLSERIADPQKIMNIYQEVLVSIPVEERIDVPVTEMAFVLDKYNDWSAHYNLSPALRKSSYEFFEKQIRELGTRSHDLAKVSKDADKRAHLFERARQYYHLYLGFFDKGPKAVKIAINLADVYYNQRNFFQSGSYYLRVYAGEFGKPTNRVDLIQNAILSLQKPADYEFYEQLRAKGMMVKAVSSYMVLDPKKKSDPALNFALSKAYFEQGFYGRAIKDLFSVVQRFPNSREAPDAADLILHYFNIRSDYKGLAVWTEKMMALHVPNATLQAHLSDIHSKAQLHRLDEQVKTQKNYDVTSQGKSYLQTALSISDSGLRSTALQQALGHSKEERDIDTFLRTAAAMAKGEKNPKKRAEIWNSMGDELLGISRFYQAIAIYSHVANDGSIGGPERIAAYEKTARIAEMLHDPSRLTALLVQPMGKTLSAETRASAGQQLLSMLESSVLLPEASQRILLNESGDDKKTLSLFKSQFRLAPTIRKSLMAQIGSRCAHAGGSPVCKWSRWPEMNQKIEAFHNEMQTSVPNIKGIDPAAQRMAGLLDLTKTFEGSGEPQLDILVTLGNAKIYGSFSTFLQRAGAANKDLAQVLMSKAAESNQAAQASQGQCTKIVQAANLEGTKYAGLCSTRGIASVSSTLEDPPKIRLNPPSQDPSDTDILNQQKSLFAKRDDWKSYFSLGESYLSHKQWFHAAATAMMARSAFPQSEEEFNAILGCALVGTGLNGEAQFVLAKASDMNNHKSSCLDQLKSVSGQ